MASRTLDGEDGRGRWVFHTDFETATFDSREELETFILEGVLEDMEGVAYVVTPDGRHVGVTVTVTVGE